MLNQHWVGIVFESFVRLIAAAQFARAGAQPLAASAFVVALGALHFAPAAWQDDAGTLASVEPRHVESVAAEAEAALLAETRPNPRPLHRQAQRGPHLSAEQQNIARFIADKYQLAIDQTQQFVEYAYRTAREVKVDPWLILAVVSVESNFNPAAQSTQGAQGLMQVLTRVHVDKFKPFGGAAAAFDPLANMVVGARILKEYLARDGTVEGALKAYVGAATLPHDGGYGAKVLSERERIASAAAGLAQRAARATEAPAPIAPRPVRAEQPQPAAAADPLHATHPVELAAGDPMPTLHGAGDAPGVPRPTTGI